MFYFNYLLTRSLKVLCPICRPKNEKVKFQRHLKDNTKLELPLKKGGLKMSLSGKITTISCRIDLGAIEPVSNSLIFQTIVPNGRTFYAAQRFNQFNFGHYKKWVIDVDKCSCTLYSSFYVCYYQRRKKASQSLNSV